jgi:hypothetical protein
MNCTEQQQLLADEVNAWHALEAMKNTPTSENNHETLDKLQAKADDATYLLRQHIATCIICRPMAGRRDVEPPPYTKD